MQNSVTQIEAMNSEIISLKGDLVQAYEKIAQLEAELAATRQEPLRDEYLLQVEGLVVSFDGFKAVDDLSLYVRRDKLHAVIGPNGAGKSTLLDAICGKIKPAAGRIQFKDIELTKLKEHQIVKAGVGRKFQTPSIYEELTVFENLEISFPRDRNVVGSLFWKRDESMVEKIRQMARDIFLEDSLDVKAGLLSHGQKQWLEIGMLLIQDHEVLLLDEPVAGMSIAERSKTAELLKRIKANRSVIVIEHDMKFVEEIADRVTVLHNGKWLSEGSMEHVKNDARVIEVYVGH